jgi:hypothetical protein
MLFSRVCAKREALLKLRALYLEGIEFETYEVMA